VTTFGPGGRTRHLHKKSLFKKPLVNNQIRAERVRVIDKEGKNLGIFELEKALHLAEEEGLDLILLTEKANPPVCKIADYGKYLYWLQKRKKDKKDKKSELKVVRLGFNISLHDLEIKAKQAEKFLSQGNKIKIEIVLRGREKTLPEIAKEKIERFLEILEKTIPIKKDTDLRKEAKGFTIIISKK